MHPPLNKELPRGRVYVNISLQEAISGFKNNKMQKKKHDHPTVGVLAGWQVYTGTPDSFLGHVFLGIQAAAHDHNCNVLMACGIDSRRPGWPLLSPEVDFVPVGPENTDGLIIVSPFASETGDRYAKDLIDSGFPAVYAGDRDSGPAVVADNVGGIRQALEHLVDHGHRQIAFVAGRQDSQGDSLIRLKAFEAGMQALHLPLNPKLVAFGGHHYEGGRQAIRQILNQDEKFTAVIASNDRSAIGTLDGLRQAGFVVPQDIAVIGFDDRLEARALMPPLTTVHYPMFGLGYQAVELLLRAIHGENIRNELIRIPTRLVVRESCGCLSGNPAGVVEAVQLQKSQELSKEQVIIRLTQMMTGAVHKESFWLSQQEVAYLSQRLVESFLQSLDQNDPLTFHSMVKQIMERVSARGDDLFAWQAAVTILRDELPWIRQVVPMQLTSYQEEDILHQVRVAISEAARGRSIRSLLSQSRESDQVGQMTRKLFAAQDEKEIFNVLQEDLPAVGIQSTAVSYYQTGQDDPVAWSVLQAPGKPIDGQPGLAAGTRFPSRQFPPPGLYPLDRTYQLAILPLKIQNELTGFVAFETNNLDPCAVIVGQLGAALRDVRLYQEAVEARKLAEEGKRLAEDADRLKSRFLSMVSHELRTPLNLITGLSKILLKEYEASSKRPKAEPSESLQEDLQRIFISAQHLDGLIRDVLDLASSDVGQLKLVCEPLDMTEVLEAVSAIGEQLARDKGLHWRAEIAKNLPRVWGDRTRLRQVTLNLVSNAVKFTSHGGIRLTAFTDEGRVRVTVQDTGLGIPPHEQNIIFDEFRQSERTAERGYGGLGLGLAICRKLVEMHNGEITVCSSGKEGEGSQFSFSLPVLEKQVGVSAKLAPLSNAQWVLLLVKDARGGSLLQEDLKRRGYEAELCVLEEASDWLASLLLADPDVVVLDLGLTSERGWEILKIMKENPATKEIPVLFYSIVEDGRQGSMLEIDYLTKPVATTALAEMLTAKGFFNPEDQRPGTKAILVVDDEPGMLELHARIVKDQLPGYRVLLARDGRQALQIIQQEQPALVLLDLMMPVLDGFGVLEEMRKSDAARSIPVVVITGQALTKEDMARLNTGVASVLGKGMFSVEETLQHLADALAHRYKSGSESQRVALKAMAFIHMNYAEPISRSDVAAHVGLSERHLTRCFHQEVGLTPITYLNRYRVKQAKVLLDRGEKGITEVAMEVGFSNNSYFTRVFREEVGLSPRAYLQSRCTSNASEDSQQEED
jgi:signal transduction histidine kinase/DNA-binding LacI/PurR family transcriptional regulator/DNA-binding response OmpR family regulator